MGASGSHETDDIISGINVTPLVDVTLVILIIFMVTASFVLKSEIPVDLPRAQSAESSTGGLLNLAITREGEIFVNGQPVTLEALGARVAELKGQAEREGKKVSAFVSADVRAQYGAFAAVLDRLRLQGIADIALDTQPVEDRRGAP